MRWIGFDADQNQWVMYRVAMERWQENESRRLRVDLNVLYGSVSVFVNDMTNVLMRHDEVG